MNRQNQARIRSGRAVSNKGAERVADIIQTAQNILVTEGLVNLTIRRVAREIGISIGNLLYYFSSKEDLLQAIIEDVIRGYDEELENEIKSFPDSPEKRFKAFIRYLIADTKKPEVRGFFYQFWGLSTHNEQCADLRQDMYKHFQELTMRLLEDVHPDMPESELGTLAFSVLTCMEGLHVVFGSGEQLIGQYPTLDDLVYTQILRNVGIADD